MELLFLGTGPAVGIPRDGHDDPTCRDARAGGKSRRRRSAALVRTGKTTVLIDAGPDIDEQLEEACVEKIDAVFLTHGHADASGGLDLLNAWAGRQGFATKLPVFTDRNTRQRLQRRFPRLPFLELLPIKPFDDVRVGVLRILPVPVEHAMERGWETFGYRIGRNLGYASDVARIPPRSADALRNLRTLILDAAFYFDKKILPSHLTTDESVAVGRALNVKRLILTQIGHTYPPHRVAVTALRRYLKKQTQGRFKALLAYDGLRIRA